jgi:chemotaxis response regulator CheB
MADRPIIGLICDHSSAVLAGLINRAGYQTIRTPSSALEPESLPAVDVWVIDCDDNDAVADAMKWLEPTVLALSNRPDVRDLLAYRDWCDRIITTLDKWTGHLRYAEGELSPSAAAAYREVRGVWLLAGSTGAPGAVRRFLANLSRVPPVAMIYAQHIHHTQQSTLVTIGAGNRKLPCYLALGRHWLNRGHVLIVPATSQLRFLRYGEVFSTREPWQTPETPNLDALMLAMCGMQPSLSGAIIFSGAGCDGCRGLAALSEIGTTIWAQDPSTCEAPSMPDAAIEAGLASYVASPEKLAENLLRRYPRDGS